MKESLFETLVEAGERVSGKPDVAIVVIFHDGMMVTDVLSPIHGMETAFEVATRAYKYASIMMQTVAKDAIVCGADIEVAA